MLRTYKAFSLLLSYPTAALQAEIGGIVAAMRDEALLSDAALRALEPLFEEIRSSDIYDLEERYVALFDRSRSLSLCLFEHVHGESRDRGGAMVDLLEQYRAAGVEPIGADLPDHLPTFLEFLATRPEAEAKALLAETAHILEALNIRLTRRNSAYAAVFGALEMLSGARPAVQAVAELMAKPEDDPDDLAALDQVWEEAAVVFGPDPNGGCPQARDMLAMMDKPAAQLANRSA